MALISILYTVDEDEIDNDYSADRIIVMGHEWDDNEDDISE